MVKNKLSNYYNNGFTIIEVLLVVSIMGILITIGLVSYSGILTSSRDSTRKSDIQQISSSLEQFKSNNEFGSYPESIYQNADFTKYLSNIPTDPSSSENYLYKPLPEDCTPSIDTPCTSYKLSSQLERDSQIYTINPYGEE